DGRIAQFIWALRVLAPAATAMFEANSVAIGEPPLPAAGVARVGTCATGMVAGAEQGFRSFSAFKRAHGQAGNGMQWHHIVEQTPGNIAKFGPGTIHNAGNLVRLDVKTHRQVSALYSSIRPEITGSTSMTIRQWLSKKPMDTQLDFGNRVLNSLSRKAQP
ncbi:MAG: hypothetical protein AB1899_18660, partial [Pseudomonadota bacterium]